MSLATMKIQVNAQNHTYDFEAMAGEKILDAGLSDSINLPYECGSGTCGTCKARIISGKLKNLWPEAPGYKFCKLKKGEFLMCQCSATSDVVIEIASDVQTMEASICVPSSFKGKVSAVKKLTSDVMSIWIELEKAIDFDAGQFMLVQFPQIVGYRGWSMVNYQRDTKILEFVIKKKPEGILSEWLFNNETEDSEVKLFGPLGSATFEPDLAKNIVCIAGGSGIAGIMSILSRASQDSYFKQFKGDIFFGVRSPQDAFFLEELSELRQQCGDKLNVVVAFSEESNSSEIKADFPFLTFDKGFIHDVAASYMDGKYDNTRAYIAGPEPLVNGAIGMLLRSRVSAVNIRYDKFS